MNKSVKILAVILVLVISLFIGNFVFWGIAMHKATDPLLTNSEKKYIRKFDDKYSTKLILSHTNEAVENELKNLSLNILIKSQTSVIFFENWGSDSLQIFMNELNDDFQKALNYKEAYYSITFLFVDSNGTPLEKKFKYLVE